jgi:hypothetical protein
MSTASRARTAAVALGAVLLSTAAATPASVAAPPTTCGDALAPAVAATAAADGYSYVATSTHDDAYGTHVRSTSTYARDNLHQRLARSDPEHPSAPSGIYADATGFWQAIDRSRLPRATVAALALLHRSDVHWLLRTTSTFRDIRIGEITDLIQFGAGLPVTSTTTDVDGTTTVTCSATTLGQTEGMTASVAATGRIARLVVTTDTGDSHARTTYELDYTPPSITAPPSADSVDVALLHRARSAVLLPGRVKRLARAIQAYSFTVARSHHHARPTVADIRQAARVTTAAFNRGGGAGGRQATVVKDGRGVTVHAVAPITGKRTSYSVHRAGRQVVVTRR